MTTRLGVILRQSLWDGVTQWTVEFLWMVPWEKY